MRFFSALLAFLMLAPFAAQARATNSEYAFVVFETTVTRQGVEISDDNPEERRFYVSNVVEFPETDPSVYRNASKLADEYFTATVVEPKKARGILHQYYDDGIGINNKATYDLKTRAEVEELRTQVLQDLKDQNANTFTFTWTRTKKPNGLESSHPILFHHSPEQPLYGEAKVQPTEPKPGAGPQAPVKRTQPAGFKEEIYGDF